MKKIQLILIIIFLFNSVNLKSQSLLESFDGDDSEFLGLHLDLNLDGSVIAMSRNGFSRTFDIYEEVAGSWELMPFEIPGFYDYYGSSISLSNDGHSLAIGNSIHINPKVEIYEYSLDSYPFETWNYVDYLPWGGDLFGYSVGMSGNGQTIVAGAPDTQNGTAAVYNLTGNNWVGTGGFNGSPNEYDFGYAVAISRNGNFFISGAPYGDFLTSSSPAGTARVYQKNGANWTQRGADINGDALGETFGQAVSINADGSVIIIGAPREKSGSNTPGKAKVFNWNGSQWVQKGSTLNGLANKDYFGFSVDISDDGDRIIVGSPSKGNQSAYVKLYSWDGTDWSQYGNTIQGGSDDLGWTVAISGDGNRCAIGAPININSNGFDAGRVDIYDVSSTVNLDKNSNDSFEFDVYPNPASDQLIISGFATGAAKISLFDPLGNSHHVNSKNEKNNMILNTSVLSPGLYFLKVTDGKFVFERKVLIE